MASKRTLDPDQRWAADQVQRIHERLIDLGDPERAAWDRDYLHSSREHLGVALPDIRKTAREFQRELGDLPHPRMLALLERAWTSDVHDLRSLAVALLERWKKQLTHEDLAWLERWLIEAETWALVDWLAVPIIGSIVEREPDHSHPILDRWAGSSARSGASARRWFMGSSRPTSTSCPG